MTTWFVVVDAEGQPFSIGTVQPEELPKGLVLLKPVESEGQPDVADWFDPVRQETVKVARAWDEKSLAWGEPVTPAVVDRVLDLKNDPALAKVTGGASAADAQAMLDKLGAVLGEARYRYATDTVEIGKGDLATAEVAAEVVGP